MKGDLPEMTDVKVNMTDDKTTTTSVKMPEIPTKFPLKSH